MSQNYYIFPILLISIAVLVLHLLALKFFLYWSIWWFDIVVHLLAGALTSIFFLWIFRKFFSRKKFPSFIFLSVIFSLTVALLWEVFEFMTGITFSSSNYVLDTSLDVLMTVVGGLFGATYLLSVFMFKSKNLETNKE